jgi:hypothetical protein
MEGTMKNRRMSPTHLTLVKSAPSVKRRHSHPAWDDFLHKETATIEWHLKDLENDRGMLQSLERVLARCPEAGRFRALRKKILILDRVLDHVLDEVETVFRPERCAR